MRDNVRHLSAFEVAMRDAPDTFNLITTYRRHQITQDNGKKVWRQDVVGREITDDMGRSLYKDQVKPLIIS